MKLVAVVSALVFVVFAFVRTGVAQEVGAAVAVDSLHISERSTDSLAHLDSLIWARLRAQDERLLSLKQVASQRSIDLTNDGKPEILRLSGKIEPDPSNTVLTFTIKQGKKLLFSDSWKAADYFDPIDHLTDTAKLRRLHRYVTVAFANENFTLMDSSEYAKVLSDRSPGEIAPGSAEARELIEQPRVMFNVFAGLDRLYGMAWLPKEKRFVKVWQN